MIKAWDRRKLWKPKPELGQCTVNPLGHQNTFLDDFRRNVENMHRELAMNPAANQAAWEQELVQLAKLCAQEKLEQQA